MLQSPQQALTLSSLSNFQLGRTEDLDSFIASTTDAVRGVQTGLPNLDSQLRGLQGIVGILGGPKSCKSTLALQVSLYNAAQGNPVLFIDRENGLMHMRERIVCSYYNMSWKDFCAKSPEQKSKAFANLTKLPFFLYNGAFTLHQLSEWVEVMMASGCKNAVLVLDSLHKLPMINDNIRMSVDGWLLFLDELKLRYNRRLTIITTCEKGRGKYDAAHKDGAKESGRIEYTLEQQLDMRNENGTIILECSYNRHGPTGDRMYFEPVYSQQNNKWSFLFKLKEKEMIDV